MNIIEPINNLEYLEKLLNNGYEIKGPRNNVSKDLRSFRIFLKKGKEFTPENWLSANDYQAVPPSSFTNNKKLMYKTINDFPDERFQSNYSITKNDITIPLYLKVELPKSKIVFQPLETKPYDSLSKN